MADTNINRTVEHERLGAVFVEIAQSAGVLKRLASLLQTNGITTLEDERAVQSSMEAMAERVGMLADLGATRCGQSAVVGDLAGWTMPYASDWAKGVPATDGGRA